MPARLGRFELRLFSLFNLPSRPSLGKAVNGCNSGGSDGSGDKLGRP